MASMATWCIFVACLQALAVATVVPGEAVSCSFNVTNRCSYTVWPAVSSGSGSWAPESMGEIAPGEWRTFAVPKGWSGRVWARVLCPTDVAVPGDGGTECLVTGYVASSVFGATNTVTTYYIVFCAINSGHYYYTPPAAGKQQPTITTLSPDDGDSQVDESRVALIISILGLVTAVVALIGQCLALLKKCCS